MSDTADDEKPVVEDEHPTIVDDTPSSVWQRLSLKQLRWTAVALILVVTAAFGGLKTAHHVTSISFGQTYNAGAVQITPHSISLIARHAGLPRSSPECKFLMLRATIRNTANESVPFPFPGVVGGSPGDCHRPPRKDAEMFAMTGIANQCVATFHDDESISVPAIDPGFTSEYRVLWSVSAAELRSHAQIVVRIYKMSSFISTFMIAHRWSGDADQYAELRIPTPEPS